MAEFDNWAPYYDLIHQGLPGEAEFYIGQAVRTGGKTLELGCGTGRIAIPMAMTGVHTTGLDNSQPMLQVCREKLQAVSPTKGSLRLVHADITDYNLGQQYDLIVMPYRTFMHLHTPHQQKRCLEITRDHLKDDGTLILNTWNPKAATIAANAPQQGEKKYKLIDQIPIPETGGQIHHYHRATFHEHTQQIIEEHLLQETDTEGNILEETTHATHLSDPLVAPSSHVLTLTRTWTTPREMAHLLHQTGYTPQAQFGDFNCTPPTPTTTETIYVLKKES